jgi:UDP-galactopyranose mutase
MSEAYDLVCLSHLRWDFVFQRPQHLLTRCARSHRTYFVEEPVFEVEAGGKPRMDVRVSQHSDNVFIAVPNLPEGYSDIIGAQRELLDGLIRDKNINRYVLWYYTPMALPFSDDLKPIATVYDCMDQLANFDGAHPELRQNELTLFKKADVVFTGGQSLYEAKREEHGNVHAFPSSVEAAHFAQSRSLRGDSSEPADQASIAHPRAGFFGVVDERLDIKLLGEIADLRPDFQFVIIGPVVKIDPASLPQRENIHYLGGKQYKELPSYLAGWDVAMMPFAINKSTEFISPTKTPEYLAAGCPVVSTPIKDVIRPYQALGLVHIASDAQQFAASLDAALADDAEDRIWRVDDFLSQTSWDRTWQRMSDEIDHAIEAREAQSGTANVAQSHNTISLSRDAAAASA